MSPPPRKLNRGSRVGSPSASSTLLRMRQFPVPCKVSVSPELVMVERKRGCFCRLGGASLSKRRTTGPPTRSAPLDLAVSIIPASHVDEASSSSSIIRKNSAVGKLLRAVLNAVLIALQLPCLASTTWKPESACEVFCL